MEVKMLKRHQGHEEADVVKVEDPLGRYWIMCGVAKKVAKRKIRNKNAAPKTEDK